jgi:hypothetical protein
MRSIDTIDHTDIDGNAVAKRFPSESPVDADGAWDGSVPRRAAVEEMDGGQTGD